MKGKKLATVDPRDRMVWRADDTTVDLRSVHDDLQPNQLEADYSGISPTVNSYAGIFPRKLVVGPLGLTPSGPVCLTDNGAHDATLPCVTERPPKSDQSDLVQLIGIALVSWLNAGFPWV